jgi:hypothetical protein
MGRPLIREDLTRTELTQNKTRQDKTTHEEEKRREEEIRYDTIRYDTTRLYIEEMNNIEEKRGEDTTPLHSTQLDRTGHDWAQRSDTTGHNKTCKGKGDIIQHLGNASLVVKMPTK